MAQGRFRVENRWARTLCVSGLMAVLSMGGAGSATARSSHGSFGDWAVYSGEVDGQKVCFVASEPLTAEGNYTRRGDIFVEVSHWPGEGAIGIVHVIAGYTYRDDSTVTAMVGDETFTLFTRDDSAWVADPAAEAALVEAMIRGSRMTVQGTSRRGTLTTDTYSLIGFTRAYRAIGELCGIAQ